MIKTERPLIESPRPLHKSRAGVAFSVVMLWAGLASIAAAEGPIDEAPLVLGNADIGRSRDEIVAPSSFAEVQITPGGEQFVPAQPEANARVLESLKQEASIPVEPKRLTAPVAPTHSASGLSFGECMERSIRAGNAFAESERVCHSVTANVRSQPNW